MDKQLDLLKRQWEADSSNKDLALRYAKALHRINPQEVIQFAKDLDYSLRIYLFLKILHKDFEIPKAVQWLYRDNPYEIAALRIPYGEHYLYIFEEEPFDSFEVSDSISSHEISELDDFDIDCYNSGYLLRFTAPGYLDQTDWHFYGSKREVEEAISEEEGGYMKPEVFKASPSKIIAGIITNTEGYFMPAEDLGNDCFWLSYLKSNLHAYTWEELYDDDFHPIHPPFLKTIQFIMGDVDFYLLRPDDRFDTSFIDKNLRKYDSGEWKPL